MRRPEVATRIYAINAGRNHWTILTELNRGSIYLAWAYLIIRKELCTDGFTCGYVYSIRVLAKRLGQGNFCNQVITVFECQDLIGTTSHVRSHTECNRDAGHRRVPIGEHCPCLDQLVEYFVLRIGGDNRGVKSCPEVMHIT